MRAPALRSAEGLTAMWIPSGLMALVTGQLTLPVFRPNRLGAVERQRWKKEEKEKVLGGGDFRGVMRS